MITVDATLLFSPPPPQITYLSGQSIKELHPWTLSVTCLHKEYKNVSIQTTSKTEPAQFTVIQLILDRAGMYLRKVQLQSQTKAKVNISPGALLLRFHLWFCSVYKTGTLRKGYNLREKPISQKLIVWGDHVSVVSALSLERILIACQIQSRSVSSETYHDFLNPMS